MNNKVAGLLKAPTAYRDELYAARRFVVNKSRGLSSALASMRSALDTEQIFAEVKARRYMKTPCEERNRIKFATRQAEFDRRVCGHIQRIIEIEESLK